MSSRIRATAFVDYTRSGPLKYLAVVAELADDGSPYHHSAYVAEYETRKEAEAHVRRLARALRPRPKKGESPR